MDLNDLKYPIGKFQKQEVITNEILQNWISDISSFPQKLFNEVNLLSDEQLDTPYRPEGWSIRQVVHHCADSHMNSLIRFKLALTEEQPIIKPYVEDRWAELIDSKYFSIEASLKIIEGLHERWTVLLNNLNEKQLARTFVHPEHGTTFSILENIGIYSWHCNHHLAHITNVKKRNNWN